MKKLLLVSNRVFHYRARIYNAFSDMWRAMGWELHVVSNEYQAVDFPLRFVKHELPFGSVRYARFIGEMKPDVVINFLHLKDRMIIPLTHYCRLKHIPMIYWNHGVNLMDADNRWKNAIFHYIHTISDAIILYTPDQLKYLARKNLQKTFIAFNTLSFEASDTFRKTMRSCEEIKAEHGIKEKRVLLYISRILPYKGLDILLSQFKDTEDIALVVVGGGISKEQQAVIDSTPHYYYLCEKYGNAVDEIYSIGDVFSTPGHIGLALNQAMYWGLPVLVLNRHHAPEIYYMEHGQNGFILDTEAELKAKVIELCHNDQLLNTLSANARKTYETRMRIENMFDGFDRAVKYVTEGKA